MVGSHTLCAAFLRFASQLLQLCYTIKKLLLAGKFLVAQILGLILTCILGHSGIHAKPHIIGT